MKNKITVHTVCRDEIFIYYAIKSVYDYAGKILLYDTGTTDKIALEGMEQLLKEDRKKKIIYKEFDIGDEESKVIATDKKTFPNKTFGVGQIRQLQIEHTNTEFCMIVDGDEIHYKESMEKAINILLPNLSSNKYQVGIPMRWFKDLNTIFDLSPINGRYLRTDKVCCIGSYPLEFHARKDTKEVFTLTHKNYLIYKNLIPYAHFHVLLKLKKREFSIKRNIRPFRGRLPEVMENNRYYINKFLERSKK